VVTQELKRNSSANVCCFKLAAYILIFECQTDKKMKNKKNATTSQTSEGYKSLFSVRK
jgi:hypothetical protein